MNPLFSNRNFYLISYDISEDRSRQRVMKLLKGHGFHVQKSVFECLLSEDRLKKLLKILKSKIDPDRDSVRVYALCRNCVTNVTVIGRGELSELPLVEVV